MYLARADQQNVKKKKAERTKLTEVRTVLGRNFLK